MLASMLQHKAHHHKSAYNADRPAPVQLLVNFGACLSTPACVTKRGNSGVCLAIALIMWQRAFTIGYPAKAEIKI